MLGWFFLLAGLWCAEGSQFRRWLLLLGGRVVPAILIAAFTIGYMYSRDQPGGIASFSAVLTTYSVPDKVLSSWFELLALALLACRWVVDDSATVKVPRPLVTLSIVLGFLAAALGLLAYALVRMFYSQRSSRGPVTSTH